MFRKSKLLFLTFFLMSYSSFSQTVNEEGSFEKVRSQGIDIYYRVFGEGEPILIIGGGPGDHSDRYLGLAKDLSRNFKCILVDQRGTGQSTPAVLDSTTISVDLTLSDFEAIRTSLGFDQWTVLGFSYGGFLSSLYAHFHPQSISSLILMESIGLNRNTFGYFMDNIRSGLSESDKLSADYWMDSTRMAQNRDQAIVEWIRAIMPGYFYDREKSLLVSETMKESHFNFDVGRWIWGDIFKRKLNLKTMESNYSKPVLILHGRQDPVGESVPQDLKDYYANSELIFIEKCGHYAWIEQPEKVYSAIGQFLNR